MAGLLDWVKEKAKQQYQQGLLNQVINDPASIGRELGQLFDPAYMSQVKPMTQEQALDVALSAPMMLGTIKPVAKTVYETAQDIAQKNAALPVSKGGLGLPANNTAMDRARAMGYTTPAYHGTARTPDGIKSFDFSMGKRGSGNRDGLIGTFSTNDSAVASDFANFAGYMQNSNVMPLLIKQQNPWKPTKYKEISDLIDAHTIFNDARRYPGSTLRMVDDIINPEAARKELIDKGYDSIFLENTLTDSIDQITPINQYVSIKPENIRSRFAAFDPFRRNEADILAGIGAVPVGLLTDNKRKEKKK